MCTTKTKTTYRNDRSGEEVTTELSPAEVAKRFAEVAHPNNWLWFWLTKEVNRHAQAVQNATECPVKAQNMADFIGDSFLFALGMGLKRPMIRMHFRNDRYKIYLSKRGTICIKTGGLVPGTHDPDGDEVYMGCIFQGKFLPNKLRKPTQDNEEFLARMMVDPVGFMAQASKDMGRCCYCNQPLEDQRSKDVGYGETCAERWGLPWGKSYDEKVPSFADLWGKVGPEESKNIRQMCGAIRKSPRDEFLWNLLGDALEDAGYTKRPTMPPATVIIPSV